ncbi:extracellular solute-binding protein [Paenibacillus sp.]|jgi:putative aldouronate transport system substrate-binding protein|uniref:extracellular solute-binding protein n=1 Tax=Paenibacillus sp. TaxID=58172 RepID=UPI0028313664|nr:extracellular solute-binding protein [Paenibacillus sp.]MDR0269901.1 extracellular solute-binding protein [Paenibacillus sp.]
MKKWMIAILASTMLLASGCGANDQGASKPKEAETPADPFYKYPEPVTLTIAKPLNPEDKTLPAGDTVDNNQFTRYIFDKTNIKFDYTLTAKSGDPFTQKVQVAIASNDIPDVMVVSEKDLRQLVEAGQLEDMSQVYEKYASKQVKDFYATTNGKALEKATFDGKMMAIPNIVPQGDAPYFLWVRKDWLDKLGLQEPKTLDDIEAVAKAFVEKDPDGNGKADTVGLPGSPTDLVNGDNGFASIFSYFDAYPSYWMEDKEGKVSYGSIQPQVKDALAKLRDWYAAGLIDKEFALRKEAYELMSGGKAGMFFGPWWMPWGPLGDAVKNDPNSNWVALAAPLDAEGNFKTHTVPVSSSFVVVKKGVEHPEAAMIALNTTVAGERGTDPDAKQLDNRVNPGYWPMRLVIENADTVTRKHDMLRDVLDGKSKPEDMIPEMQEIYAKAKEADFDPVKDLGAWQPYFSYTIGSDPLHGPLKPAENLFTSITKTMELKNATLSKMEKETYLKIIMGKEPLDSFDTFVEQWKKLGGDQITKEVREALGE